MQVKHYQAVECSGVVYRRIVETVSLNAQILVPRGRRYKFHHPSNIVKKKKENEEKHPCTKEMVGVEKLKDERRDEVDGQLRKQKVNYSSEELKIKIKQVNL